MVRTERIRLAATEEELRQERLEKEALRSALRVVEGENGRLRTLSNEENPHPEPEAQPVPVADAPPPRPSSETDRGEGAVESSSSDPERS